MRTQYHTDSLVPAWLAEDPGYLAGLREYLANMMELQGYRIVVKPTVQDDTGASMARIPVGFRLLNAWCVVEEFDVEVG